MENRCVSDESDFPAPTAEQLQVLYERIRADPEGLLELDWCAHKRTDSFVVNTTNTPACTDRPHIGTSSPSTTFTTSCISSSAHPVCISSGTTHTAFFPSGTTNTACVPSGTTGTTQIGCRPGQSQCGTPPTTPGGSCTAPTCAPHSATQCAPGRQYAPVRGEQAASKEAQLAPGDTFDFDEGDTFGEQPPNSSRPFKFGVRGGLSRNSQFLKFSIYAY